MLVTIRRIITAYGSGLVWALHSMLILASTSTPVLGQEKFDWDEYIQQVNQEAALEMGVVFLPEAMHAGKPFAEAYDTSNTGSEDLGAFPYSAGGQTVVAVNVEKIVSVCDGNLEAAKIFAKVVIYHENIHAKSYYHKGNPHNFPETGGDIYKTPPGNPTKLLSTCRHLQIRIAGLEIMCDEIANIIANGTTPLSSKDKATIDALCRRLKDEFWKLDRYSRDLLDACVAPAPEHSTPMSIGFSAGSWSMEQLTEDSFEDAQCSFCPSEEGGSNGE